jgi:hypothetical protein
MAAPRSGYSLPVDPLNELGDPAQAFRPGDQLTFMRTFVSIIRTFFQKAVIRDQAAPFITLQSPGGKTFRVTVTDDGAVQATDARVN